MSNWLVCASLSALCAGLVAIFGKLGVRDVDSTIATTARSLIMAASLCLFTVGRGQFGQIATISPKSWLFVCLAGLAGAASWLFYFQALKVGEAIKVAPVDRLSIIVSIFLAWAFLGEKVSSGVLIGSGLVLVGVLVITRG